MFSSSSSSLSLDDSEAAHRQRRGRLPARGDPAHHEAAAGEPCQQYPVSATASEAGTEPTYTNEEDPTLRQRQQRVAAAAAAAAAAEEKRTDSPPGVSAPPTLRRRSHYRHRSPPPPGVAAAAASPNSPDGGRDGGRDARRPAGKKTLTSEDLEALVQQQYRLYGSDSPSPTKDRVALVRPVEEGGEGEDEEDAILAEHHFAEGRDDDDDVPPLQPAAAAAARDDQLVGSAPRRRPGAGGALDARDAAAYLQLFQSSITSMASSANTSRGESSPPPHETMLSALTEEMERLGFNDDDDDARAPSVAPAPTPSPASSPVPKKEQEAVGKVLPLAAAEEAEEAAAPAKDTDLPSPSRQRFERTPSPHTYFKREEGAGHDGPLSPPAAERDADVVDSPRPTEPPAGTAAAAAERREPSSRRSLFPDATRATEPREDSAKSHTAEPPRPAATSSLPRRGASRSSSASLMEVTVEEMEEPQPQQACDALPAAAAVSPLANVRWVSPATTTATARGESVDGRRRKGDRHQTSSVSSAAFSGPAASGLLASQYTPLASHVAPARGEAEAERRQQRPLPPPPPPPSAGSGSRIRFSSLVSADNSTTASAAPAAAAVPLRLRNGPHQHLPRPTVESPSSSLLLGYLPPASADLSTASSFEQPWQRWGASAARRNAAVLDSALHTGGGTNRRSHAVVPRQYHVDTDAYRAYEQSGDDYFYPTELERVTGRSGMGGSGVLGPRARVTAVLEARDRYDAAVAAAVAAEGTQHMEVAAAAPASPGVGERRSTGHVVPFVYSPQRQAAITTAPVNARAESRLLSPHFVLQPSTVAVTAEVRRPLQFGGEETPPPTPATPAVTGGGTAAVRTSAVRGSAGGSAVRFSGQPRAAAAVPLQQVPFISSSESRDRSASHAPAPAPSASRSHTTSADVAAPNGRLSAETIAALQAQERRHLMDMYKQQKALEEQQQQQQQRASGRTVTLSPSTPRRHSPSVDELVQTPKRVSTHSQTAQRQEGEEAAALLDHIRRSEQQARQLAQQRVLRAETVARARLELLADHGTQELLRELHFCQTVALLQREAAAARERSAARATEAEAGESEEEKRRVLRRVRREQCELAAELESLSRELQSLVAQ